MNDCMILAGVLYNITGCCKPWSYGRYVRVNRYSTVDKFVHRGQLLDQLPPYVKGHHAVLVHA